MSGNQAHLTPDLLRWAARSQQVDNERTARFRTTATMSAGAGRGALYTTPRLPSTRPTSMVRHRGGAPRAVTQIECSIIANQRDIANGGGNVECKCHHDGTIRGCRQPDHRCRRDDDALRPIRYTAARDSRRFRITVAIHRTHALLPGSVAIDAGDDPVTLGTDQRGTGFPRVVGAQRTSAPMNGVRDRAIPLTESGFDPCD